MSIYIAHVTNGEKNGYYVRDSLNETINVYGTKEDIPKNIRGYAPNKEAKYWGPDTARIMGCRSILYPDFPDLACDYYSPMKVECIAESCKYAQNKNWTKCPYFNG